MAHKHKHPCACCGRGIASHRTKAKLCSKTCRAELRIVLKAQRKGGQLGLPLVG